MTPTILILADDPAPAKPPAAFDFFPLILLGIMFVLLIILPGRKERKRRQEMLSAVDRGARVVIGGGIVGVVDKVEKVEGGEDELLIKIDPNANVKMRVLRGSVNRVLPADKKDAKDGA